MRQFEPASFMVSMEVQIDPTDNQKTVIANAKKQVREEVEGEVRRLKIERRESLDDELEKST